jgi:alkylation response protein AidB-like acyl-CoA dehydrogenase
MIATLGVNDEQNTVLDMANRFMRSRFPMETVRGIAGSDGEDVRSYHQDSSGLGWFGLLVPEEFGGAPLSSNPLRELALLALLRGRHLQPGPFLETNVVAYALSTAGTSPHRDDMLKKIVNGESIATCALAYGATGGSGLFDLRGDRPGFVVSGTQTGVADADIADWILVSAASRDGVTQLLVPTDSPGVSLALMEGVDLSRRLFRVNLERVPVSPELIVGDAFDARDSVERQFHLALVIWISEAVGTLAADLEMAVEYAKVRRAFGRPIGSFQAIKHLLANSSLFVECAEAMMLACIDAVGQERPDAAEVVSVGKAFVSEYCIEVPQNCLQVFGGVGYTWEHNHHLYMRRAAGDAARFGDGWWHRERICDVRGLQW